MNKIQITKEQYDALKGTDVVVVEEVVYYLLPGVKKASAGSNAASCPLTNIRVTAAFKGKLTSRQRIAYSMILKFLPVGEYMARGEVGEKLFKQSRSAEVVQWKLTRHKASYYVTALLERGALEVAK